MITKSSIQRHLTSIRIQQNNKQISTDKIIFIYEYNLISALSHGPIKRAKFIIALIAQFNNCYHRNTGVFCPFKFNLNCKDSRRQNIVNQGS